MRLIDADALLKKLPREELVSRIIVAGMPAIEAEPVRRGRWIPIKTRPMDEEERREWSEKLGYDIEYSDAVIFTSQLPDDGQTVLTSNRYGHVCVDTFCNDEDGCYFEDNCDMDGIVAWMPLPEPYCGARMEEQE